MKRPVYIYIYYIYIYINTHIRTHCAQFRGTGYPMNLKVNENEVRLTYADGKTQTATHFA